MEEKKGRSFVQKLFLDENDQVSLSKLGLIAASWVTAWAVPMVLPLKIIGGLSAMFTAVGSLDKGYRKDS